MSQPQTPKKPRSTATTSAAKPAPKAKSATAKKPAAKSGRAQAIVKGARDVAATAAVEAEKAAKAGAENAKKFALSAADFAVEQGKRGAALVEDAFEREFNRRYPLAVANVARIRKAHASKSPAEVLDLLATEFSGAKYGTDSQKFIEAAGLYVLSAVEVHGKHVKNVTARAALVNIVLVGGSPVVLKVAPWVAIALSLLSKRIAVLFAAGGAAAQVADRAKPAIDKAKKGLKNAGAAAKLIDIEEPGKRSIGWAVIRATRSILGTAPANWPAAPKTAPAKTPSKTPVKTAAKPAAKKPVAKPAATKPATKPAAKRPTPKAK